VTPEDADKIGQWQEQLEGDARITLRWTGDEQTGELLTFCEALSRMAPQVVMGQEEADPGDLPAIEIGDGAVTYHAIPAGTKLSPFLQAVSAFGGGARGSEKDHLLASREDVVHRLKGLDVPAYLRLFVAPNCPFCPVVTEQALTLAAASSLVHLAVIDGTFFPELAESENVRSAPTLLLDGHFRWTGRLNLGEVLEAMTQRDPAELSADVLEGMLKAGNGSQLIEMMLEREVIFPSLVDLLAHEKIFVRVGAMMVMEEIAHRRRDIAAQVTDPLWDRLSEVNDPVKGDIIHVLGEIGDENLLPPMREIVDGDYDLEVKEAAREAIMKITDRVHT
jgi:hypothetical protein